MTRSRLCPIVVLLLALLAGCTRDDPGGIDVSSALGGEAGAGFARATKTRRFVFPEDHNAHRAFRNEWWYVTGHLQDAQGRRFGYQLTFFRIALTADPVPGESAWATGQVWMAHAALTAIDDGRHHHDERLARGALGLAGQEREPFRVWVEDWSLSGEAGGAFPWTLRVATDAFSYELTLEALREPLLQGDEGLSQKSADPGNASYYYSITRLATHGTLTLDSDTVPVTGLSWLDREWSTSALGENQSGWDWFSLQLDGGEDLMLYRLRDRDGDTDPHSAGSVLMPDGRKLAIAADGFELEAVRWWTSGSGMRYPVAWRLRVPRAGLDLLVEALVDDQEMQTGVRYWEGAVDVRSAADGERIGQGYLEMTGYDE